MRTRVVTATGGMVLALTLVAACTSAGTTTTPTSGPSTGSVTSGGAGGDTSGGASGGSTSGAAATGQGQKGGTLVMLAGDDLANLDPITAYQAGNRQLSYATTRYLYAYGANGSADQQAVLHPDIATDLPTEANGGISADGKTVTIKLRDGVQWSTTPARDVTAADFVREFKMLCNPARPVPAPGYYTSTIVGMTDYCAGFAKVDPTVSAIQKYVEDTPLSGVAATDDHTLVFHLISPTSDFPNILGMEFSAARPVEYMQYLPESKDLRAHLIADGPYMISAYNPGVSMELTRNPNWDSATDSLRPAYVDKIQIKFGVSADNAQQQLQAGTADLGFGLRPPTATIPGLVAQKDPNLTLSPPASTQYLVLNTRKGPMSNTVVRQAVDAAVSKTVIQQLTGGKSMASVANQVPLPGSSGYIDNLTDPLNPNGAGNPDKAKQLLAQAGYPNGVAVTLAYSTTGGDAATKVAQAYQSALQKAGFQVTLKPLTASIFTNDYMRNPDAAEKGLWDIAPSGWAPDWRGNNGRAGIVPEFADPGPQSTNFAGYDSEAFNALVAKALSAKTAEEANDFWKQANQQVIDDMPVVPVQYINDALYVSSRLQGCTYFWYGRSCALPDVWLKQ